MRAFPAPNFCVPSHLECAGLIELRLAPLRPPLSPAALQYERLRVAMHQQGPPQPRRKHAIARVIHLEKKVDYSARGLERAGVTVCEIKGHQGCCRVWEVSGAEVQEYRGPRVGVVWLGEAGCGGSEAGTMHWSP